MGDKEVDSRTQACRCGQSRFVDRRRRRSRYPPAQRPQAAPLFSLPPHSEVASPPSQVFLGGAAAGVATFVFVQPLVLPALLAGAAGWAVSLRRQERKGF